MIYYVEVERGRGQWNIVGQYATREDAVRIAKDYHERDGENARVTTDDDTTPPTGSDR
jgi:hypothetical protein